LFAHRLSLSQCEPLHSRAPSPRGAVRSRVARGHPQLRQRKRLPGIFGESTRHLDRLTGSSVRSGHWREEPRGWKHLPSEGCIPMRFAVMTSVMCVAVTVATSFAANAVDGSPTCRGRVRTLGEAARPASSPMWRIRLLGERGSGEFSEDAVCLPLEESATRG
jgi:hypothetical protein